MQLQLQLQFSWAGRWYYSDAVAARESSLSTYVRACSVIYSKIAQNPGCGHASRPAARRGARSPLPAGPDLGGGIVGGLMGRALGKMMGAALGAVGEQMRQAAEQVADVQARAQVGRGVHAV